MTEDEKKLFRALVSAVDHLMEHLSCGAGIFDYEELRREWHSQTEAVRLAIDNSPPSSKSSST